MCKILYNCTHLQWSHFYKRLLNLCIYCYYENVIGHLHQVSKLKTCVKVRLVPKATTTTNVKTITKFACECCSKNNEQSNNFCVHYKI